MEYYRSNRGETMSIYQLGEDKPDIPASAYVAVEATVIGKVTLGERVSIWPGAVIRGDNDTIQIGAASNVQDGAVLHVDRGYPLTIGAHVTIGHQAMLHGCTVGDCSLIGIGATILSHAVIGKYCLVGAGALITERKVFADRSLIIGAPARRVRELTDAECRGLETSAANYAERGRQYRRELVAR